MASSCIKWSQDMGHVPLLSAFWCERLPWLLVCVCRSLPAADIGGPLPESFGDLKEVRSIVLSWNYFEGTAPASWSKLTRLETL